MLASPLLSLLLVPDLLDRLARRFSSFLYLLTNDTSGVEERWRLAPLLLLAWFAASLLTAPLSHLAARALGSSAELRKSTGVATGVAALQIAFFALHWFVVAWGRRELDWGVFGMATIAAALIAKWGHELSYLKCLIHVVLQSAACLGFLFLASFAASELGWTAY